MRVKVYSIEKKSDKELKKITDEFIKKCAGFAKIEDEILFNKDIANAQNSSEEKAKESYTKIFKPKLSGFNIALDVEGEMVDSFEFSKLLEQNSNINFFIGGAYGFERGFLKEFDSVISLSKLTMGHKIAKVVLFEQIYRGFAIINSHPYHK